jgi:hypothetical protein
MYGLSGRVLLLALTREDSARTAESRGIRLSKDLGDELDRSVADEELEGKPQRAGVGSGRSG